MSEKTKDIIDTLLCSLYMAVFCVPPIFLLTGLFRSTNWELMFLMFVFAAIFGALSGVAAFSDRKAKAGIKWAVSVPFSIGIFIFLVDTRFLLRMEKAMNAADYSNGDGVGFMLLLLSILTAVVIGNIIGISHSGRYLSTRMENVLTTLQKVVCPLVCAAIVILVIGLVCVMPQAPHVYG